MDIIERIKNDISLLKEYIKNSNEKLGKYKKDLTYINNKTNKMINIINIDYSKEYLIELADNLGNYELFCAFKDYILKYNVTLIVYSNSVDNEFKHIIECEYLDIRCSVTEFVIDMECEYMHINIDNLTYSDLYDCNILNDNNFTKPEHLKDITEIIKCCVVNIIYESCNDIIFEFDKLNYSSNTK